MVHAHAMDREAEERVRDHADDERFEIEVAPVERVLLWSSRLIAADFDCPPSHPRFKGSGPLMAPCLGWTRTQSSIYVDGVGELLLEPSCVVFLPAGTCYERRAVLGCNDVAEVVGIESGSFHQRLEELGIDPDGLAAGTFMVPAEELVRVRACFASLRNGGQPEEEMEASVIDLVEQVLASWTVRHGTSRQRIGHERSHLVERARLAALNANLDGSPLAQVAGELGVSPEHLCRVSRSVLGMPFGQYVMELRLRKALHLMQRSDLGLLDIALECGFSSHPHFSNAFRKKFGDHPSSVRPLLKPAKGRA